MKIIARSPLNLM